MVTPSFLALSPATTHSSAVLQPLNASDNDGATSLEDSVPATGDTPADNAEFVSSQAVTGRRREFPSHFHGAFR